MCGCACVGFVMCVCVCVGFVMCVCVCVGFVMCVCVCVCYVNMFTCLYSVFCIFCLCKFILIFFVRTSVRTAATE